MEGQSGRRFLTLSGICFLVLCISGHGVRSQEQPGSEADNVPSANETLATEAPASPTEAATDPSAGEPSPTLTPRNAAPPQDPGAHGGQGGQGAQPQTPEGKPPGHVEGPPDVANVSDAAGALPMEGEGTSAEGATEGPGTEAPAGPGQTAPAGPDETAVGANETTAAPGAEQTTAGDVTTAPVAPDVTTKAPADVTTSPVNASTAGEVIGGGEQTTTTGEETTQSEGNTTTQSGQTTTTGDETTTTEAANTTVPETTSVTEETTTEEETIETTTTEAPGPSYDTIHEKADFVLRGSDNNPCLLASLNVTIRVTYHVQEGPLKEEYETTSAEIPRDATVAGLCGDTESLLSLSWANATFTLNITFILTDMEFKPEELALDVVPPEVNSSDLSWIVNQVSLSYDTSDSDIFPSASDRKVETVSVKDLKLFQTPLGSAYLCQTTDALEMEAKTVHLEFNYVHFQPFGVTPEQNIRFVNDTVECSGDLGVVPDQEEAYTVPLVVACCLAAAVVIIIVAYASHRYVTRRLRQSEYKQME